MFVSSLPVFYLARRFHTQMLQQLYRGWLFPVWLLMFCGYLPKQQDKYSKFPYSLSQQNRVCSPIIVIVIVLVAEAEKSYFDKLLPITLYVAPTRSQSLPNVSAAVQELIAATKCSFPKYFSKSSSKTSNIWT